MQFENEGLIADPTEAAMQAFYADPVDLSDCEREPLHLIQVIQPHACLLVVDRETMRVEIVSENAAAYTGCPWRNLLGRPLSECLEPDVVARVLRASEHDGTTRRPIRASFLADGELRGCQILQHTVGRRLLLEIEPSQEGAETMAFQQRLSEAIARVQSLTDYRTMFADVTEVIAQMSGYDRVSLYRFDADYNGEVIAERIQSHHESWLNLRYPASDIPKQARELYLRNRVRMLSDVRANQVFLRKHNPGHTDDKTSSNGEPQHWDLDLSLVDCRGLSPVHKEYLENIGTAASMSVAIILEGRLWGLFALHHDTPRYLDFELRGFLRFLGQVFSGHLALQSANDYRRRVLEVNVKRSRLGNQLFERQELGPALTEGAVTVLDVVDDCDGAIVSADGELFRLGDAPSDEQLAQLAEHIRARDDDPLLYKTDRLCEEYDDAGDFQDLCAGVLLVWLDHERNDYIAWFRHEIERKVAWAGSPEKREVDTADGGKRWAPRKSFAKYIETVKDRSEPWTDADVDAALGLRSHVKEVLLREYNEVKRANSELATAYKEMEAFSYTVSHDLRAPLRSIDGFAEILQEDYAKVLDAEGLMMLAQIQDSAQRMNVFIDDLLELAKLGTSAIEVRDLDIGLLSREVYEELAPGFLGRAIDFRIQDDLPAARGDRRLLSVALHNLIGNALKYSAGSDPALVEVGYDGDARRGAFFVRDNGEGFPQEYAERAFEMFTRLTDNKKIEGTGVGLALVQRVVNKHGGEIWVETEPDRGSTFYFCLVGRE